MQLLRKYSKHLIGFSFPIWLLSLVLYFFNLKITILLIPLTAVMLCLGIIGWLIKPKTKLKKVKYLSKLDLLLGLFWENIAPYLFTLLLSIGIFFTNYNFFSTVIHFYNSQNKTYTEYYPTGELMKEYEVKSGMRHGFFKYYYKDGTIRLEYTNKNNKKNGQLTQYYKTGQVENRALLKNEELVWNEFYDYNGVRINKSEQKHTVYYNYFSDLKYSSIEFTTNFSDSIKTDSLLYEIYDSVHYYSNDPHEIIFKYLRHSSNNYETIDLKNNLTPSTNNSWEEMKNIRDEIIQVQDGDIYNPEIP